MDELQGNELEAALLETLDNVAHKAALDAVRLKVGHTTSEATLKR
jgi:hypothetical protein